MKTHPLSFCALNVYWTCFIEIAPLLRSLGWSRFNIKYPVNVLWCLQKLILGATSQSWMPVWCRCRVNVNCQHKPNPNISSSLNCSPIYGFALIKMWILRSRKTWTTIFRGPVYRNRCFHSSLRPHFQFTNVLREEAGDKAPSLHSKVLEKTRQEAFTEKVGSPGAIKQVLVRFRLVS